MIYGTEILKRVDWNVLSQYIEKKHIIINKHPMYDLWILNYTKLCVFEKAWDLYTISCRGLVIDAEGKIISRCMKKFFNMEELDVAKINMTEAYEIYEKMDGSMISVFYYDIADEWIVASRGSFASDQAIEAKKILETKNNWNNILDKNKTYVFEVIY